MCLRSPLLLAVVRSSSFQDLLNNRWYEVAEKIAREKVGQALRDVINQKEQAKESGEEEEESNSSLQKRRRLTVEDDYEKHRPFSDFMANPRSSLTPSTSDVGVAPPAAISLMLFQNHSPGFVRQNTVARMEEVFSKIKGTKRGARSLISSSISPSKHYQSLGPTCRKMEDHHHQGASPPVTYGDNHLTSQWSLADLEPRPLRPPFPNFATNKEGNYFDTDDHQQQDDRKEYHGTFQNDHHISPEEAKSYYL